MQDFVHQPYLQGIGWEKRISLLILAALGLNLPQGSKGPNNQVLGFRIVVM